jgi:hypothetical protein
MLQITINTEECWDESKNEFVYGKTQTLCLEHSLVSISKWEGKWLKPFLSDEKKTNEETIDYIRCMTITQNVDPDIYRHISNENVEQIYKYIESPMTATWFSNRNNRKGSRRTLTAELIYCQMIALNIPFECQKWHLNKLLTLIRVCDEESHPPKKMSKKQLMSRNAALNAARRNKLNSKG